MKAPQLFPLILLLIYSITVRAQSPVMGSIQGSLIDEEQTPLSFASVLLRKSSDHTIYKTSLTNEQGIYHFLQVEEGRYSIEFQMMGYETQVKKDILINEVVKEVKLEETQMIPALLMISEVVVKGQVPLIERRADRIIVNLNNSMTATSIMELMDRLPGVTVSAQDVISLNGKPIVIYMDGKRTPLTGDALASFLRGMPSANIQKVELIANPSSKYDAAGSGGIINIVKKKDNKEGVVGSLYGSYVQGRYGKSNGGITLNYKKNTLYNIFFNTNFAALKYFIDSKSIYSYFTQNKVPLGQSIFTTNSIRDNQTITPTVGVDFYLSDKTMLSISTSQILSGFKRKGQTFFEQLNGDKLLVGQSNMINDVDMDSRTNISNIHLVHKLDTSGQEITADLDYSNFNNISDFTNSDMLYDGSGNFITDRNSLLDNDGRLNLYAIKLDYSNPLSKTANIEAGWKSSYIVSNNHNLFYDVVNNMSVPDHSKTDRFKYSENINALYFNFNKKYDKLSMQLGVRSEHTFGKGKQLQTNEDFTNQYIRLFPSISLDYNFDTSNGLTLNLNKRINRPTYESLNPLLRFVNSSNYIQGNPTLLPGLSYNSSLRYSYKNELFFTFSYDVSLKEQITVTSQYDNSAFTSKPENDKRANYFSALMSYSKPVTKWWNTNNSVQIWQQRYNSIINGFEVSSNGMPALSVSTFQTLNIKEKASLYIGIVYLSKYQSRNRITENNYYSNAGIRLKILDNTGTLFLGYNDIFNTYNAGYVENSVLVNQDWNNSFDNRAIVTSFTYNFGKGRIKSVNKGTATEEERKRTNVKEN